MKKYTRTEFDRIMRNNGFVVCRQGKGSHTIYERNGVTESIPRKLEEPVALRIIKKHNLNTGKIRRMN